MKYDEKFNDIIAYLKSEEYEELDNGNYKYTNENGISIEQFAQESDKFKIKDCTEFVERFSYKGVKIFDYITCKNKNGDIEYQERACFTSKKIDKSTYDDNYYYEIVKKYIDIINNAAHITIEFDKSPLFKVEKSTIDDRYIIRVFGSNNIIIELFNDNKYAFIRYISNNDGL